ncbi:hypothetical protein ACIBCN_36700 [Nocardia sp. NPDC051052]|uniref:hypothetical protein n=1 Tax=Nocardia sp. NPDC051052 TaxID=3364322 RepID=UPI0037986D6A
MNIRTIALAAATVATGAAAAAVIGAGSASAVVPIAAPEAGIYGVQLSPGETQAMANGPLPALISQVVPHSALSVGIEDDSALDQDDDNVYASLREVIGEAASRPNGKVDLFLAPGPELVIFQDWS